MKKYSLWKFAVLAAMGLQVFLPARTQAAPGHHAISCRFGRHGGAKRPPPKIPYEAVGSVNVAARTLMVVAMNTTTHSTKVFKISPDITVTVNGHPATLGDLRQGMRIEVGQGMDADVADRLVATPAPVTPKTSSTKKQK